MLRWLTFARRALDIETPTQGPEAPGPVGEIVATIYAESSGSALFVEPLPPQPLNCLGPPAALGCPVARVWYGLANVTPQQQADAEWLYRSPDLDRNWVLVVGHFATVTVRDHRNYNDDPVEQIWFMVNKLYMPPFRGRVIERPLDAVLLRHRKCEQRPGRRDQPRRALAPRGAYHMERHGHVRREQRPQQRRRHVRDGGSRLHALSSAPQGRRIFRPADQLGNAARGDDSRAMCVLAFAWRAHPRWPLVVAGNRDELHARPASPLARWDRPDHLFAGRDLQSGGSWLGVTERGRFAVVTNLRGYGAPEPGRASRGALVTDYLSGDGRYADLGEADLSDFNPFNLITADRERACFLSNRPENVRSVLAPGIYGLSNGALDEPWPKTMRLKEVLLEWIVTAATRPEVLLDVLREERLPGVGIDPAVPSDVPQEPSLSPIFIRNPVYGTRCSTVVAVDDRGEGLIIERGYTSAGDEVGKTALSFSWSG